MALPPTTSTRTAIEAPWRLPYDRVLEALGSTEDGLTTEEATRRLAADGPNELGEQQSVSAAEILLRQFRGPLIYLLLIAALVTVLLGEYVDAAAITLVLLFNASIGLVQEYRAERSMEALNRLVAARATILRGGREFEVDAREIVPGDLVLLEAGSRVPADLRIGRAVALEADESLITGESTPASKVSEVLDADLPVSDRANMLLAGTTVTRGRCRGVVTATAGTTQLGQIAGRVGETARGETPLQRQMAQLGRVIGLLVLVLGTVGLVAGTVAGEPLDELFFTLVALAVSAIPKGLPVVFTITLAVGMRRMAARNVIIRRLPAVETLGSCDVIGSDKTGTLTENRMTVQRLHAGGVNYEVSGTGYDTAGAVRPLEAGNTSSDEALRLTLVAATLCNEAAIVARDGDFEVRGDPTEVALLVAAAKAGMHRTDLELATPRFGEIPFDPDLRFAATFHHDESGTVAYVKGAPERVIEMCSSAEGLAALDGERLLREADRMAEGGLRVLAMATAHLATTEPAEGSLQGLTFLGLAGMMDPPRAESAQAVRDVRSAGMRVVMVTGDHVATASAIARQVGIASEGSSAVAGPEFAAMSDEELDERLDEVAVYARVAPEHKLRLVRAFQRRGHIIAMTGDGVNDAPALKAADIGVAMGRGGTDVAREAADMVIEDDNFSSIIAGVEEARIVFDNVRNATFYLISSGVAEVLMVLASIALAQPLAVLPVQLLWLNVVTNGVQDVALAVEPGDPDVRFRPPRPPSEHVISRVLWERTAVAGVWMAAGALALFLIEVDGDRSIEYARTVALTSLVVFQVFHVGNARSERRSALAKSPLSNRFLIAGTSLAMLLHVAVIYTPGLQRLLRLEPLELSSWLAIVAVCLTIVPVVEVHKWLRRPRPER